MKLVCWDRMVVTVEALGKGWGWIIGRLSKSWVIKLCFMMMIHELEEIM